MDSARTTPVPSIQDLVALYEIVPGIPPNARLLSKHMEMQGVTRSVFEWIRRFFHPLTHVRPNVFKSLKEGKKSVIFAVVDAGTMNMYRFNEGCFDEWPMI
jgi:tRNA-splicing endonuclease subunit Sen54